MAVIAEKVAVEVGAQPVDQFGNSGPIACDNKIGEFGDRAPLPVGFADDLAVLEVGDEKDLPHQEFGKAAPHEHILDRFKSRFRQFRHRRRQVGQKFPVDARFDIEPFRHAPGKICCRYVEGGEWAIGPRLFEMKFFACAGEFAGRQCGRLMPLEFDYNGCEILVPNPLARVIEIGARQGRVVLAHEYHGRDALYIKDCLRADRTIGFQERVDF
ncbi:hypothetical protein [Sphingopyxis sp. RIFCSPHIGHO2_12_FULL_65_19]|uniref:hypothetical protein n=1 Tax=Sphingopyxis sp. RIFCSPHIGHO2_12_FULL_65_19 TaxID=1802172 RepID=UPI0025FEB495|nr:hypothetical protein [Sphingopyxis sp. RIFCSPHIGHO2_12_FULL_65_19]